MKQQQTLCWREVIWNRPFELEAVHDLLTHLASTRPRGTVVWEIRGNCQGVHYLLGTEAAYLKKIQTLFQTQGEVRFAAVSEETRFPVSTARQLKITRPTLSVKTDTTTALVRAGLAAFSGIPEETQAVLQILLGASFAPAPVPRELPNPHASWLSVITGNAGTATSESMSAIRGKSAQHGFHAVVRIGLNRGASPAVFQNILSALKTLETAGVRILAANESTGNLNSAHAPWHFPLRLSIKELANFLLLPIGELDFPGTGGLHPKTLLPPAWYRPPNGADDRCFAVNSDSAQNIRLSIPPKDALEHTVILGPTGSGKSTAMLHLILRDIQAGRSVLVIDPKADLVNDILRRIPPERDDDVVVLDPSGADAVGFNPFAFCNYSNPTLVADALLSVFQSVFKENWGIRSQDVLSHAFLTLAKSEGASLLWLPALLTNADFRQKLTAKLHDPLGLTPFWTEFEALKDSERRAEIAPVLNKIRQFLLRPGLRNVLGQSKPNFDLTDLFHQRKIVLVPLNKGTIGAESAQLLGSLLVGMTWTLALSRANTPPEKRHMVSVFIDELQDYLRLPGELSDALAQARGLGLSLTLAHQYREQLPPNIRAGIDANCRNKIVFGLQADDAKAMAAMAPELDAMDFMKLPRYRIYTSFQSGGRNTGWVSGQTLPPPPASREAVALRAKSMKLYGKPASEVETEYLEALAAARYQPPSPEDNPPTGGIGRWKV